MVTILRYAPIASAKIDLLVKVFDVMVEWYGVIRHDGETAVLEDIIVYPQISTRATCREDPEEGKYYIYHLDPDVVRSLRYHGCSYVVFPAEPSKISLDFEEMVAEQLHDGEEFFFDITNREGEHSVRCYTNTSSKSYNRNQLLFDKASVDFDGEAFLKDARKKIRPEFYLGLTT